MTDANAALPTPADPGHHTLSRGLTGTLQGFLYAAAATALGGSIATFNEVNAFDEAVSGLVGALPRLERAEEASAAIVALFALAGLVTAVLAIVWWYQAYRAVERAECQGRRWSAGWAVGAWFIPFANLVIPKLVFNEIDRCSAAAEAGSTEWRSRRLLPIANWWWVMFVVGSVLISIGSSITTSELESVALDIDAYRTGLWFTAVGLGVDVAAGVTGAISIKTIGDRLAR